MKVSVLVPTYLRPAMIRRCLECLLEQTRLPDEVVVVTKRSDPASAAAVDRARRELCEGARIRRVVVTPVSILAAECVGLAACGGDIVAFTDDDAAPRPAWLEHLLAHYADPTVGGVGGRDVIHLPGGEIADDSATRVGAITWYGSLVGNHHASGLRAREVSVLKGCNMSFRRALLPPMDYRLAGEFTLHYEADLCLTVKRRGYRLVWEPAAIVDHRYDISERGEPDLDARVYADAHNQLLVALKHYPVGRKLVCTGYGFLIGSQCAPGPLRALVDVVRRRDGRRSWTRVWPSLLGRIDAVRSWARDPLPPRTAEEPLRVLVVHCYAAKPQGGAMTVLQTLLHHFDPAAYRPSLVFLNPGEFAADFRERGIRVHVLRAGRGRQFWRALRVVFQLWRLIRDEQIDVVLGNEGKAHFYAGWAAWLAGVPAVWIAHAWMERPNFQCRVIMAVPAAIAVGCSAYVTSLMRGASSAALRTVPNGTELPTLLPGDAAAARVQVCAEFGLPLDAPLVILIGLLVRWKGQDTLVHSVPGILRRFPGTHFLLLGGVPTPADPADVGYDRELEDLIVTLGLQDSVQLIRGRFGASLVPFWKAADIIVHTSLRPDPFPMVILEAMSYAKPVIASDLGGPRESVVHGETGLLVPPGDPALLADACCQLLGDPAARAMMGRRGRIRVETLYSAARMTRDLEAILQEAALRGVPAPRVTATAVPSSG